MQLLWGKRGVVKTESIGILHYDILITMIMIVNYFLVYNIIMCNIIDDVFFTLCNV